MRRSLYGVGRMLQVAGAAIVVTSVTGSEVPAPSFAFAPASVAGSLAAVQATPAPTPSPSTAPATVFADLTTIAATVPLPVSAEFAPAQADGDGTLSRKIAVRVTLGAAVRLSVDGNAVPSSRLASVANDPKAKTATFTYVSVTLLPGPNRVIAVPVASNGLGTPVEETVFGPERASSVAATLVPCAGCRDFVADGTSRATLHLVVRDRFDRAAASGERVVLEVRAGDVHFIDTPQTVSASPQPTAPATGDDGQRSGLRRVELAMPAGGVLEVPVASGLNAGSIDIEATVEGVSAHARSYLKPLLRAPFVNGLASIGTGSMPAQVDGSDAYDGGGSRRSRVGVFATGAVSKNASVTLAYESQNRLSPLSSVGNYTDDPSERPYLTYGDSSIVNDPYRSNDHLYARYDRGRSSLMWGQFQANVASETPGSYSQLLSGAKADVAFGATGAARLTAFTARNQLAYAQQIVPITGLSVLQTPLRPEIVVGSDVFIVATVSRQTGAILNQQALIRNLDYSIDYATGVVRFITIPLPFDQHLNPNVLVLQYQYAGDGSASRTTGAQFRMALSRDRATELLAGVVNDATGTGNYALSSQSFSRQWQGGSLQIAHARSAGVTPGTLLATGAVATPAPAGGDTYSLVFNDRHHFDDYNAQWATTELGYVDPFGGLSTAGLTTYRAAYHHNVPGAFSIGAGVDGALNDGAQSSREQNEEMTLSKSFGKRLKLGLGLERHVQNVTGTAVAATPVPVLSPFPLPTGPPAGDVSQTQAVVSAEYHPTDRIALSAERIQTVAGSDQGSTQPTQTTTQASYAFAGGGRIYARELWSVTPAASFSNAVQGLVSGASATHVFEIGAERAISASTSVSSDYQVVGSGNSRDVFSMMGVSEKLRFGPNLGGSLFAQGANSIGTDADGFTVYGVSLAYHRKDALQSTFSYQRRSGFSGGSSASFGINGALGNDVAVAGTLQRSYGTGSLSVNDFLTIALRPKASDRMITLVSYQRANGFSGASSITDVVSVDQLFRPNNRLEFSAKYALKLDGDSFYTAHTSLVALRVRETVGTRFDVGGEVRYLDVPGISGAFQTDAAAEAGFVLGDSSRLAAGYDFRGTVDPTLLGQPAHRGVYVTLTTLIDRVFGWGKPR